MSEEEREAAIKAAMKVLTDTGAFDGILVLASSRDADGRTVYHRNCQGNAHAAEGVAREYLRTLEGYQAGWYAENGRYDKVVARQQDQARPRPGDEWRDR